MDYNTLDEVNARIKSDPEMVQLLQDDPTEFKSRATKVYKHFGFNADGSPMRSARKFIRKGARALGMDEDIAEAGVASILPTIGTVAGGAVGSRVGPAGLAGGAMLGSAFGEELNSAIGITEPMDTTDRAIALGAPLLGPLVGRTVKPALGKGALRALPGSGAGLNELASEEFTKAITKNRVGKDVVDLARKELDKVPDFDIPVPGLKQMFDDESFKIGKQSLQAVPNRDTYLKRLNAFIEANPGLKNGKMNSKDLMAIEAGFNDIKSDLPGEIWGAASGQIINEMERTLSNPNVSQATKLKVADGLQRFKHFIAVNNKNKADDALLEATRTGGSIIKIVPGDKGLVRFDKDAMKKFFDKNAAVKKAFSPAEIDDMKAAVNDIGYLSTPPANNITMSNAIPRFGAGGTIGWAIGGGTSGAVAGAAVEEVIRQAVTTQTGRNIMKMLAKKGKGRIDALELNTMLGQVVAGASAGAVPGVTGLASERPKPVSGFANEE